MSRNIVFRIIAGLVLLAAIAGIAFFAYQAGISHGMAANIQASVTQVTGSPEFFHGERYGHFMGFAGFGIFGWIFGLLFVFLLFSVAFGAMRRMIWGPRWGWRHMGHGSMGNGSMRHGSWSEGIPPMFAEWHRRAHSSSTDEPPADHKPGQ